MLSPTRIIAAAFAGCLLVSLALPVAQAQTSADSSVSPRAWISLPSLPESAASLTGAAVNGKFYVFGGRDGTALNGPRSKGLVYEYDTANDTWTRKRPMPVPLHHPAVAAYGDRIYLFGGFRTPARNGGWQPVADAWAYDPATDNWEPLTPMAEPRGGAAAAAIDGKFYVIGGAAAAAAPGDGDANGMTIDDRRRHDVLASVVEYDPKTGRWRARAAMPTSRSQAVAVARLGRIFVIGGRLGSTFANGSETDIVEAYEPAADRWSAPLARLPTARSSAGGALWRHLIVVAGGSIAGGQTMTARPSALVDAYDTIANRWISLAPLPRPRAGFAAGVIGDRFHAVGGTVPGEATQTALDQPGVTDTAADTAASALAHALELDTATGPSRPR